MLEAAEIYLRRNQLLASMTYAEKRIGNLLADIGTFHRLQEIFIFCDHLYFADFYICDSRQIVLECDGPNHCSRKNYDEKRTKHLLTSGRVKRVIRLSNNDCHTINKEELRDVLKSKESGTYTFGNI
jgi:very-short-patch-repair endonuclease